MTLCPYDGSFHQSQLCAEPGCPGFVCSQCGECSRDHDQAHAWRNFAPDQ
jgi:hypothetical protein